MHLCITPEYGTLEDNSDKCFCARCQFTLQAELQAEQQKKMFKYSKVGRLRFLTGRPPPAGTEHVLHTHPLGAMAFRA